MRTFSFGTALSDNCQMIYAILKTKFEKCETKQLIYGDFNSMIFLIVQII